MSRKQKRMGPVGCFGQIENIKRQSLIYLSLSAPLENLLTQYKMTIQRKHTIKPAFEPNGFAFIEFYRTAIKGF